MRLKKETRVLLVDRFEDRIVAIVIRGYAGVEGAMVLSSCSELYGLLESRRGMAAEVNYVLENDVCKSTAFKTISLSEVGNMDIVEAVEEAMKVISVAKARYTQLKAQLGLRT